MIIFKLIQKFGPAGKWIQNLVLAITRNPQNFSFRMSCMSPRGKFRHASLASITVEAKLYNHLNSELFWLFLKLIQKFGPAGKWIQNLVLAITRNPQNFSFRMSWISPAGKFRHASQASITLEAKIYKQSNSELLWNFFNLNKNLARQVK